MSDITAINQVLAQMQALKTQAAAGAKANVAPVAGANAASASEFGNVLKQAMEGVNRTQHDAAAKINAFERGDPGVDLAQAMIASQKAGIEFRAATEVRNRFVRAYQDIMNMPI